MRILVLGGFGYDNTGDEALLDYALRTIVRCCPSAAIVVGAPFPQRTLETHAGWPIRVIHAPRECFFSATTLPHYGGGDGVFKWNWLRVCLQHVCGLCRLAQWVRARTGVPAIGHEDLEAAFIKELKACDLLYYCGGGYNTGRTTSRLWDTALVMLLAWRHRTKVFMSSQQVGVWTRASGWLMGAIAMSRPSRILVRDRGTSSKSLASVLVRPGRRAEYCDEAVFTEVRPERLPPTLKPLEYVVFSFRDGFLDRAADNEAFRDFFARLVDATAERGAGSYEVVLAATGGFDLHSQHAIRERCRSPVRVIEYDYRHQTAAAIFGSSLVTVSFPHHPLIFAIAGGRPVVSVLSGSYYRHKNVGSMRVYGMERFCIEARAFDSKEFRQADAAIQTALREASSLSKALTDRVRMLRDRDLTARTLASLLPTRRPGL